MMAKVITKAGWKRRQRKNKVSYVHPNQPSQPSVEKAYNITKRITRTVVRSKTVIDGHLPWLH